MAARVAAILLAAGRGTRFGEAPKLLAELDGVTLVRHAAEAALASSAHPVLVVVGHRAAEVTGALADLPVTIVSNPAYADGLSTSLRTGFAQLPSEVEAAIVLLGDMPRVTAGLVEALASFWRDAGKPDALVPTFGGRRGNPVLLSTRLAGAIAALTGDAGAGPLLRGLPDVREMPVEDPAVTLDVDTPAALAGLARPT